jgi:hypothetical protein
VDREERDIGCAFGADDADNIRQRVHISVGLCLQPPLLGP